jgi:hypothetical protein
MLPPSYLFVAKYFSSPGPLSPSMYKNAVLKEAAINNFSSDVPPLKFDTCRLGYLYIGIFGDHK